MKKIISLLLVFIMLISVVNIATVTAESEDMNQTASSNVDTSNDLTVSGTNSFGAMVAAEIDEETEEQLANNGCNVFSVDVEGNLATVSFQTTENAVLVVAIYDEAGEQLLASGNKNVTVEEEIAEIEIETDSMPQYFYLKAYLVEPIKYHPLCTVYESPNYTQEMQEFFALTVNDFEEEKVLNFDESEDNNFAVLDEETKIIPQNEGVNEIVSADETNSVYVIENADDYILSLQPGDIFAYNHSGEDSDALIVKVATIEIDGTTATITGEETSLDEVFEIVKLEGESSTEDMEIDDSEMDEGVTYNGLIEEDDAETYNSAENIHSAESEKYDGVSVEGSAGVSHSFKINKEVTQSSGFSQETSKITGGVDISFSAGAKVYISWSQKYLELKIDYSAKIYIEISTKLEEFNIRLAYFCISPVAGVYIEVSPGIVLEVSATVKLEGGLYGTVGFKASNTDGMENLTTKPKFKTTLKIEGKAFLGINLNPKIKLLSDKIAEAKISSTVGVEVVGEINYNKDDAVKHDCKICVDGKINAVLNLKFSACLLKSKKLTFKLDVVNAKYKISNWYYSFDHGIFGPTACPFKSYKTTVTVKNSDNRVVTGATVTGGGKSDTTNSKGVAVFYLPNGNVQLRVTASGYSAKTKSITIHNETKKVTIKLGDTGSGSSGSGNGSGGTGGSESQTVYYNGFTCTKNTDGTLTVTKYSGDYSADIPAWINGRKVTAIASEVFYNLDYITTVSIPNTMTSIGDKAFCDCDGIQKITIPGSVKSIGKSVFSSCGRLNSITLSEGITSIGEGAFSGTSITSITIPKSVTRIEDNTFWGCDLLRSVVLSSTVTSIGNEAFWGCSSLQSVTIPNSVISIGDNVFSDCYSLETISLPNSLKTIGAGAFSYCSSLQSITIPNGVTRIEGSTFEGCESLETINLPDSIKEICFAAFYLCTSLTTPIKIPEGQTYVGDNTFQMCNSLKSVSIPDSVTEIGHWAFRDCGMYSDDGELVITDRVTSIGEEAFTNCGLLKSIVIPNHFELFPSGTTTEIPEGAFSDCTSLETVTISEGVTGIGEKAFENCTSLEKIIIPEGITQIEDSTFEGCYLLWQVSLPNSLKTIDSGAFAYCSNLHDITIPSSVTSIAKDAFDNPDLHYIIGVPGSYAEQYAKDNGFTFVVLEEEETVAYATAPKYNATSTEEALSIESAIFTDLLPNEIYNFYMVKTRDVSNDLESDNLLYITQATSDESGNLTISYIPKEDYENAEQFVVSMTRTDISETEITVPDIAYSGEDTFAEPVIMHNGYELQEGIDYELERDYSAKKAGEYTVIINGIGDYIGTIEKTYKVYCEEHIFVDTVVPPTATEQGYTDHTCEGCGYNYKDNYTDYTPTIPDDSDIMVSATGTFTTEIADGDKITPYATIRNIGDGALSEDITIIFAIDGRVLETIEYTEEIGAGESVVIRGNNEWTSWFGSHTISTIIIESSTSEESDTSNNFKKQRVLVN